MDGHREAVETICAWLDAWRQDADTGPWWPQWITRDELHTGRPRQRGPLRPSWCYGTPGIARAHQLAAIATHDVAHQERAESVLARCLSDPAQLDRITDGGLCHGWAGVHQTAWRAAQDARTPEIRGRLPRLADHLGSSARAEPYQRTGQVGRDIRTADPRGLLEGFAGLALALQTAAHDASPITSWDACLLIN